MFTPSLINSEQQQNIFASNSQSEQLALLSQLLFTFTGSHSTFFYCKSPLPESIVTTPEAYVCYSTHLVPSLQEKNFGGVKGTL